jgi:hypothetical protein
MAVSISNFNCLPNLNYYVVFDNNIVDFRVYLYKTLAEAQSGIGHVANSTGNDFGSAIAIILENSGDNFSISKYDDTKDYHIEATMASGDSDTTFHILPFHSSELQDELLTTEAMVTARATLEINRGTHVKSNKVIELDHSPTRLDGNVIRLNTTDYTNNDNMVEKVKISWDGKKLTDNIDMYLYENLVFYEEP